MFVRGRGVAVACVLAAVLATGCSSGDKPVALPSLSPSASPSASPSPTSTSAELAAVSAVVHRYFELINGPTTTDAADELFAMMTPTCSCRRAARSMRDAAQAHESYFGTTKLTSFVANLDGPAAADVLVDYDYSRAGLKNSQGKVLNSGAARRDVSLDFRLVGSNNKWLISDVQIVSNGTAA